MTLTHSLRIRRIARAVQALALAAGVAACALDAWLWLSPARLEAKLVVNLRLSGLPHFTDAVTRLQGFGMSIFPIAVLLFALWQIHRLFAAYARGEILTLENADRMRMFALGVGGLGLMRPVWLGLFRALLADDPAAFTLRVGLPDALVVMVAGIFLCVGWVLAEAARLREENDQFV